MENRRITIEAFISYAHKEEEYADPFLDELKDMLAASKKYDFAIWWDQMILPGETWLQEIRTALERCKMGLLLVSPAFLSSPFITEEELPKFVREDAKPVIPIMLKRLNLKRFDLKGLDENQLFQFKAGPNNYRSYAQCGSNQRNDFVYELHERIEARLDKVYL